MYGTFNSADVEKRCSSPTQTTPETMDSIKYSGQTDHVNIPDLRQRQSYDVATPTSTSNEGKRGAEEDGQVMVENFQLKREVGLSGSISLIIGGIVGSGIFISPKGVLEGVGSAGMSLVIWTICGMISLVGSFGMVELGTCIPKSGGDYSYVMAAYGSIPGFLYAWLSILFLRPASASIMALTCSEYLTTLFFNDGCGRTPELLRKLTAAVIILTILGINVYSVKLANRIGVIFSFAKIAALVFIIIAGIVFLCQGKTQYLTDSFKGTSTDISRLSLGFYSGMWAYDGWNNLNYSMEEVINPVKTLPRAILIAVPLCTVCYVLVNVSYLTILSPSDIIQAPAVAVTWAEKAMPQVAFLFPIFVSISTFGSAHASLFSGGRMAYAAAREGHMVGLLSMVDITKFTPSASLIFTSLVAVLMLLPADIGELINYFSFTAWMWYGATALALIILRWKMPDLHRPYKVPLVFPVLTILVSLFLVVGPLVNNPKIEFLYAALSILAGLIFYFPLVYFKLKVPGTDSVTTFLQLALKVAPPNQDPTQ